MENANTRIVVKDARFAYVHLLEPRAAAEGAEAKYSVTLIIPKTDEAGIAAIKAAMKAAVSKKFGDKPPKGLRNPLRDGDEKDGESGEYMKGDEFRGNWYLSASSKKPVRALAGKARMPATDEHLQSGNYGAAELNFYGYDAAGNRIWWLLFNSDECERRDPAFDLGHAINVMSGLHVVAILPDGTGKGFW